jgi:hypothetical protein
MLVCGRYASRVRELSIPTREPWKDNASNDLCLWTSMTAGMMSPGRYKVSVRWIVVPSASGFSQSNALIFRETDGPVDKLDAMWIFGFDGFARMSETRTEK